jgi:hypothetical protein
MPSFSSSRSVRMSLRWLLGAGVEQKFRHEKQADAAAARRRVGQPRQHHVDRVVGEVVVAVGDKDLLPGDPVMLSPTRVARRHGAGSERAEVGAGLRLGQVHRAGPLARHQFAEIARFLLGRAVRAQHLDRAVIEQWAQRPTHAGRVPHLGQRRRERLRQTLATGFDRRAEPVPAAIDIGTIGFAKPGRGAHDAVFEDAADFVADAVKRRQLVLGEFRGLVEHRVGDLGGVGREVAERIEHQAHVGERSGVGHRQFPKRAAGSIADQAARAIGLGATAAASACRRVLRGSCRDARYSPALA